LCQQALRPTKVYFSKRKEVRQSHAEEIDALLERAAAIGDDSADWKAIAQLRSEASAALRTLDGVEPQTRTALAKRLKDVIARLSALGDAHDRDIEAAKRRLIEQATALSQRSDRSGAAREARELQKKWTTLGNGRRNVDQRQWREFRAACDAVFGQLDAARKDQETQATAARVRAEELVQEFEALAADETTAADIAKAKLRELDAGWQEIASDDRALQQRQRRAYDTVTMRLKDAVRRTRLARYTNAMHKYTFVRGIETDSVTSSQEAWDALPATTAQFDVPLAARLGRASAAQADADQDAARDLLVQLEFLAGVESPDEDRQRRMNHQVRRLSSRMREGAVLTPENELAALLATWFAQAAQPAQLEQRFERAARAAIDALP
jgi:exonuclease SbcC